MKAGKALALKLALARILLKADQQDRGPAWTDAQIAEALNVSIKTVFNVRRKSMEHGLVAALERKKQESSSRRPKLDGKTETKLVATCCGPALKGRAKWTLRLLANKVVELGLASSISLETVWQTLKNRIKPWLKTHWCLPKEHDAEFVWRMADVLGVYERPYDPRFPVICMAAASKQLIGEVRKPLPPKPGAARREGKTSAEPLSLSSWLGGSLALPMTKRFQTEPSLS